MKAAYLLLTLAIIGTSCSNQRMVTDENDDLYYSSSDRFNDAPTEFNTINEVSGEQYRTKSDFDNSGRTASDYYVLGSERNNDANPNAFDNYIQSGSADATAVQDPGSTDGTINNFYGSTNYYYEDDGFDNSYSTRIRRFSNSNMYGNYGYYDPYFVDPYWNYGWAYHPYINWFKRRRGWAVGWNSWSGWNLSYNWGWGNYNSWGYNSFYGYNPGWNGYGCGWGYNNGWGNYNGWGYGGWYGNNYWNGYNNGYWNGWNDGTFSQQWANNGNKRPYLVGRKDLVNEGGFGSGGRGDNPLTQNTTKEGQTQGTLNTARPQIADQNNSNPNASPAPRPAGGNNLENISQVHRPSPALIADNANPNAAQVATTYNRPAVRNEAVIGSSQLVRAPNQAQRYPNEIRNTSTVNAGSGIRPTRAPSRPNASGVSTARPNVNGNSSPRPNGNSRPSTINSTRMPSSAGNGSGSINRPTKNPAYSRPQRSTPVRTGTVNQSRPNSNIERLPRQRPGTSSSSPSRAPNRPSTTRPSRTAPASNSPRPRSSMSSPSRPSSSMSRPSSPSRSASPGRSSSSPRSFSPSRSSSPSRGSSSPRSGGATGKMRR